MDKEYEIIAIDYAENDALLKIGNNKYYFQFTLEPTLEAALEFIAKDTILEIKRKVQMKSNQWWGDGINPYDDVLDIIDEEKTWID